MEERRWRWREEGDVGREGEISNSVFNKASFTP